MPARVVQVHVGVQKKKERRPAILALSRPRSLSAIFRLPWPMAFRLSFAAQTPSVVLSSTQSDEPDVRRHESTALNHSRTPFSPCRTRIEHLLSRSTRKPPPHLLVTSQRNRNPRQSTFDFELHPCLRRYRLPRGITFDHDTANSALSIASSSQPPARLVAA